MSAGSVPGWVLGVVAAAVLAGLSRVPVDLGPDEPTSELRLSWRALAPTEEQCRPPTEAELSGLPAHMRPQEVCEGGAVPYDLTVSIDGEELRRGPASTSGERTVTVYESYAVTPGEHDVLVTFQAGRSRTAADGEPTSATAPAFDPGGDDQGGGRASHTLRRTLLFEAGRARLITLQEEGLSLVGSL